MNSFLNCGTMFQMEQLADGRKRVFMDTPEDITINISKLNASLKFLQEADLPLTLYTLNQLFFQGINDPGFVLSDDDKRTLEDLSVFLIKCWIAEKQAA